MMHIPPEAAVNALLKQGCMIKAGPDTLFQSTTNHCVILLNPTPHDDEYLVFVSASSQYLKRIEYANKLNLPGSTIVMIRPSTYLHLPKYTAIDCNYIHTITHGVLVALYAEGRISFYKTNPRANTDDLKKIIQGVSDSPLVQEEVKKLLSG